MIISSMALFPFHGHMINVDFDHDNSDLRN